MLLHRMSFFAQPGLFYQANKKIKEQDYQTLLTMYQQRIRAKNYVDALFCAQKMAILHGIPGIMLYLSVQCTLLQEHQQNEELADQELINACAIALFAQQYITEIVHEEYCDELQQLKHSQQQLAQIKQLDELQQDIQLLSERFMDEARSDIAPMKL